MIQKVVTSRGQNVKSIKTSHVRYQITGFLVFLFYSETPFWPQMIMEVLISRYKWPPEVKIWNKWKKVRWGIKSNVFWCFDSILRHLFNLRWYQLRGRSKYGINENKSNKVSNHRFFGVPIPFWAGEKDQNKWIYKKIMIS